MVGEKRCRTPLATLGAAATPFAFTHGKRSGKHVSARHWRAQLSTLTSAVVLVAVRLDSDPLVPLARALLLLPLQLALGILGTSTTRVG